MNQETSNVESAPAVAVQRVVRARHPWQQAWDAKAKLKAARAVAERRRELKWHKNHDDLSKLLASAQTRKQYRKNKGLPLDAPPAKPWDFAKGKCPNDPDQRPPTGDVGLAEGAIGGSLHPVVRASESTTYEPEK